MKREPIIERYLDYLRSDNYQIVQYYNNNGIIPIRHLHSEIGHSCLVSNDHFDAFVDFMILYNPIGNWEYEIVSSLLTDGIFPDKFKILLNKIDINKAFSIIPLLECVIDLNCCAQYINICLDCGAQTNEEIYKKTKEINPECAELLIPVPHPDVKVAE